MKPLVKVLLLFACLSLAKRGLSVAETSKRQVVLPQTGAGASMGFFLPKDSTNLGLTNGQYPNGVRGYWVDRTNNKKVLTGTFFPDKTISSISQGQCHVKTVQGQCWIPGFVQIEGGNKLPGMYFPTLPQNYWQIMHHIPTPCPEQENPLCPQAPISIISGTPVTTFVKLNGVLYKVAASSGTVNLGGSTYVVQGKTSRSLGYIGISGSKVLLQHGFPQSYVNVNGNNYIISASTDPRFIGYVFINGQYYYVCPGNPGFVIINHKKYTIQIGEPGPNKILVAHTVHVCHVVHITQTLEQLQGLVTKDRYLPDSRYVGFITVNGVRQPVNVVEVRTTTGFYDVYYVEMEDTLYQIQPDGNTDIYGVPSFNGQPYIMMDHQLVKAAQPRQYG